MAQPPAPPPPPPGAPPPSPSGAEAPPPAPTGQWYSLRGLTTALTVLLIVSAVVAAAGVAAFANRRGVANDILDGNFTFGLADRADDADSFVSTVVLLFAALWLAIAVLVIIWTFRAMKNNEALGHTDARFTSGWGIAGWLIPCANFVIPVLIFQDLWRGSDASVPRGAPTRGSARGSGLIGVWWAAYLLSSARFGFGRGEEADTREELEDLRTNDSVALFGMIATIAAAVLFILVLRRIAERQEACLRAQQPAGAGPSA